MYQVKNKRIIRVNGGDREVYEVGDRIEPTEAELESFVDNLQKIPEKDNEVIANPASEDSKESDESQTDDSEDESGEGMETEYPDLSKMNVNGELIDFLKASDFSEDQIKDLHQIESDGADRITAHQRIDEHA